jgi:hypothetical protein
VAFELKGIIMASSLKKKLPDAHFGKAHNTPMDWEKYESDDDAGDEEMDETPADVKGMLGFDPKRKAKPTVKKKGK